MADEAGGQTNTDSTTGDQATGAAADGAGGQPTGAEGQLTQGEGGEGAGGDKGGETGGEGGAPETYEFSMPEGVELDQGLTEAATPILQKYGVSQEDAQALADALTQSRTAGAEAMQQAQAEAFNNQLESWANELKNDKVFGGESHDANAAKTFEFLDKTVPQELKDELLGDNGIFAVTGLGNHPGLVKYFFHLSQKFQVGEDQPGSGGSANASGKDRLQRLYPNMANQ